MAAKTDSKRPMNSVDQTDTHCTMAFETGGRGGGGGGGGDFQLLYTENVSAMLLGLNISFHQMEAIFLGFKCYLKSSHVVWVPFSDRLALFGRSLVQHPLDKRT